MHTYANPWHQPLRPAYGPEVYETKATPTEYRGYLIFRREPEVFDVVLNGKCITQRAGLKGARFAIDALLGNKSLF